MNLVLFLSPCIFFPLLFSFIWKKYRLTSNGMTILLTIFVMMVYPFMIIKSDEYSHQATMDEPKCGLFPTAIILGCYLFLLPFAIAMQLLFNYLLLYKPKAKTKLKEPEESASLF